MIQKTFKQATAGFLALALLAPSFALAREADEGPRGFDSARDRIEKRMSSSTASSTKPNNGLGGQNFCQNIDRFVAEINKQIENRDGKKVEKREDRGDRREDRRGLKDDKLDDRRDDRDENRGMRYDKLYARASTTEAKAAVDAFKTAVESAVTARRTAVDAAVTKFRTDVDALIASSTTSVDAAWAKLKTDTGAAIAKAKADCASGKDPATVRAELKASLKSINEAFKSSTKKPADISTQVKALKDTRDASIKAAMDAFKAAVEAALAALKAALGK